MPLLPRPPRTFLTGIPDLLARSIVSGVRHVGALGRRERHVVRELQSTQCHEKLMHDFSYLGITVLIALGSNIAYAAEIMVYLFGTVRAARKIHKQLIDAILGSTLRYTLIIIFQIHLC